MTSAALIHASVTVSGAAAMLDAFRARIAATLAEQPIDGQFEERAGGADLVYDIKSAGGIPFPLFVLASQEYPELSIRVEWINAQTNERGAVSIANGNVAHARVDALGVAAGAAHPVCIIVGGDGCLRLALTCYRVGRDSYIGYAVTAEKDAMFRVERSAGASQAELSVTAGAAEWAERWVTGLASAAGELREALEPPAPITESDYREVGQLAREFAEEWLWFAASPEQDIAIERERYAKYGYAVHEANVRSRQLRKLSEAGIDGDKALVYSTLTDADAWVRDLVLRCWTSA